MPRAYSQDLRERVLDAAHQGYTYGTVAARFAVGESTVRSWLRRERLTGRRTPRPHPGGHSKLGAVGEEALRALIDERNDRTLAELAQGLRDRGERHGGVAGV